MDSIFGKKMPKSVQLPLFVWFSVASRDPARECGWMAGCVLNPKTRGH